MDSKIKFSVEGVQTLKEEMGGVLKDSVTQSKVLLDVNKEFLSLLKSQISLLKERKELLGPGSTSVSSNQNLNQSSVSGTITNLNVPGTNQPITRTQEDIKRTISQLSQAILDQKKLIDENKAYIEKQKDLLSSAKGPKSKQRIQDELEAAKSVLKERQYELTELQREREQINLSNRGGTRDIGGSNVRPSMVQSLGTAMLINPISSQDPVQGAMGAGQNISSMMMMSGGKMGWIGLGLGLGVGIAGAQVQLLKDVMPMASKMARLKGGNVEDYLERNNEFTNLGYTRSQVLENRSAALKSLGTDSSTNLSTMLALQKGFDVSQGDLTGLMRAGRGDKNFDLQRVFSNTYAGLQYAGLGKEKTEAFIPEYLKIIADLGQKQLETLGKVDYGVNTRVLSVISGSGDRLRNPDTARAVLNQFYQGLTTAQTPQVEALQFQALGKAFPGKSQWQLEKIREEPFTSTNIKYVEAMMQNIKSVSTNRDDLERNISNTWGVGKNIAGELANLFDKPGGAFDIQKKLQETGGITQQEVYKRALSATDRFDKLVAKWEDVKFTEAISNISNALNSVANTLDVVNGFVDQKIMPGSSTQSALLGFTVSKLFK